MVVYGDWEIYASDIKGKIDRGELIPDPDWQRGYIWNPKDERLLIDSILLGLPIPKLYLTEDYDPKKGANIHYVVDGQQRISAIYKFLNNGFTIEINERNFLFRDLDSDTQMKITRYKLNGHYLRDWKQSDVNFLFQRLNRTGIKLTNMEEWNNEFYNTNILKMIKKINDENKQFYEDIIYTDENIKRMLPLDDIIDLSNCLFKSSVESGSKKELESFLDNNKNISSKESQAIESKFWKVINNFREIFSKQELESFLYSKRTHFISLFLAIGILIPEYYILDNKRGLKGSLLNFINNQPEKYKESVLGAIRQKTAREVRVKYHKDIILKYAIKLDKIKFFSKKSTKEFWNQDKDHICQICNKVIKTFDDAVLDHKKPWAKGGKTEKSNAQLSHIKCCNKRRKDFEIYVVI